MMKIIKHKFLSNKLDPNTETLIIGTFNPDTNENPAEFFYGRNRNYLWRLLPTAFGHSDLKGEPLTTKIEFITKYRIGFIDLIAEVIVDEPDNYYDGYLDSRVKNWRDIIGEIETLSNIKRICFTRKSFSDIPKMKAKIEEIRIYCEEHNVKFNYLTTPARFCREDKQTEWTNFLLT